MAIAGSILSTCTVRHEPEIVIRPPETPESVASTEPDPVVAPPNLEGAPPELAAMRLSAMAYSDLPNWENADIQPGVTALLQSCGRKPPRFSKYGLGEEAEAAWVEACTALTFVSDAEPSTHKAVIEEYFAPFRFAAMAPSTKLTGYFEPMIKARRSPAPGFEEAVSAPPRSVVQADLSKFPEDRASGQGGRKPGPHPARANIVDDPSRALGWAHPADVFYLQIQGSGRLQFPDGEVVRAAFAAHNGHPFKSIARYLIAEGEIEKSQAGMNGVRAWMDRAGESAARRAMNANPRYVWFEAQRIENPRLGPKGAALVPLTPMGSMAVDPAYHAYGAPIYIDSKIPSEPGDWQGDPLHTLVVAQDTGGAIKGPVRGDLFFGLGHDAGSRASMMNHPMRMWVLLPKKAVEALQ